MQGYTRVGDKGQTKINGNYTVNKDSVRVEADANPGVLMFINRLSDYFFAVARVANHRSDIEDILYDRSGKVFHLDIKKKDYGELE